MNRSHFRHAAILAAVITLSLPLAVSASVTNISNASPNPITIGEETEFSVDIDANQTVFAWSSTEIFVDGQPYICVPQPDPAFSPGSGDVQATITVPVMAPLDQPGTYAISAEDYEDLNCTVTGASAVVSTPLTVVAPPARATFDVTKVFTDGNPGEIEVTISCNTGLPLEQSKMISEGAGVEFVVTDYDDDAMDCTITEDGVSGYDAEYFDGGAVTTTGCEYLDITHGAELACSITNTPAPVDIDITKEWVFEGTSSPQDIDQRYDLTLYCDAEIVDGFNFGETQEAPSFVPVCGLIVLGQEAGQGNGIYADWCKTFSGEGSDDFTAQVIPEYPDSSCYVVESLYDDAAEVSNGCQDITVSAGQGASCTITNTVFFEGIPTLNQYGLAIMALLMLGIGFVGFRRFA